MSARARSALLAALLLILGGAFHLPAWSTRWHPTWDSAVYLTLARNLAQGEGYTYGGAPHLKYPPGLPLLLAPLASEPGAPVGGERAVMIAAALVWMQLLFFGLRRRSGEAVAFGVALAAGLSYATLLHSVRVLSDLPFLVPWTASLLLGDRLRRAPSWTNALLFASTTLLAASVRIVALVALPVYAVLFARTLLRDRGHRPALLTAGVVVALGIGAWFLRTELLRPTISEDLRDQRSYEHELATGESYEAGAREIGFGAQLAIALGNLDYTRGLVGELASGYAFPARSRDELQSARDVWGWWFGLVLSVANLALWVPLARRRPWFVLASAAYLALIAIWPSRQGIRFLLPAVPALLLAWTSFAATAGQRLFGSRALGAGSLAVLLVALGYGFAARTIFAIEREASYDTPLRRLSDEAGNHVRAKLPGARLVAGEAAYLVYRCGIDARAFPILDRTLPPAERGKQLLARLRAAKATHLLLLPEGAFTWPDLLQPLLASTDPALLLARAPAAAAALAAWNAGAEVPGGGAALVVPLSVFDPPAKPD